MPVTAYDISAVVTGSMQVLDHAMNGEGGQQICETFIEQLGLKVVFESTSMLISSLVALQTLFPIFMTTPEKFKKGSAHVTFTEPCLFATRSYSHRPRLRSMWHRFLPLCCVTSRFLSHNSKVDDQALVSGRSAKGSRAAQIS